MKTDRRTHPRVTPDDIGARIWRRSLRPLMGALLLLLLGWSSAAPASAESGTISGSSGPRTGPIHVYAGETLNIIDGAQISSEYRGVFVIGGTVNISGGSISGGYKGVYVARGTASVYGCGLTLDASGLLTGTLEYNTQPSSISTFGLSASNLDSRSTCTAYGVNALFAQSGSGKAFKLGSTIPIKLQLLDAGGNNVSSSAHTVRALGLTQTAGGSGAATVLNPGSANPDSEFRYDATLQGYIFKLSTNSLQAGTRKLMFSVDNQIDTSYVVLFDVK